MAETGSKKTQFKKGQSGNPNGRPVGSVSVTAEIKRKLLEVEPKTRKTYLELLVDRAMERAISNGNISMIQNIWEHMDGKARQKLEHDMSPELAEALQKINKTLPD